MDLFLCGASLWCMYGGGCIFFVFETGSCVRIFASVRGMCTALFFLMYRANIFIFKVAIVGIALMPRDMINFHCYSITFK